VGAQTSTVYDKLYWWSALPVLALVAFYITCTNMEAPDPIFILLVLTTCYLIMSRLVAAVYVFWIKKTGVKGYKNPRLVIFWAVSLGIFYVVFIDKSKIHDVRTIPSETVTCDQRVSLDEWFEAWWANVGFDTTQAEIPIYLVAAQGGGSRAGLWASEILNRLEVESNYRFSRHCFAVTSASGGSSGTAATLAMWRFAQENEGFVDEKMGSFPKKTFTNISQRVCTSGTT
jgi:hypothetical protein